MERFKEATEGQEGATDFYLLNEDLKGKAESELAPEEQKAEAEFGKKNLEIFLEGIDKDELMIHALSRPVPFSDIYKEGILSSSQYKKSKDKNQHAGEWQTDSEIRNTRRVKKYIELLKKREEGEILGNKFRDERDVLLNNLPKVGRQRFEYFLDKVLPRIVSEVGYPDETIPARADAPNALKNRKLNSKEPFIRNPQPAGTDLKQWLNKEVWESFIAIMSGADMVSATSAKFMKEKFSKPVSLQGQEVRRGFFGSLHPYGLSIYFQRPPDIRLYDLSHRDGVSNGSDIAVSNKIAPYHFKALRFGLYDAEKRVLLMEGKSITTQDIPLLSKLQKEGVMLFDECLMPIPPLESISINDSPGYGSEAKKYKSGGPVIGAENHPTLNKKLFDWLNKETDFVAAKNVDQEAVAKDYVFNLMFRNQEKSLDMIESIIKEKSYNWAEEV